MNIQITNNQKLVKIHNKTLQRLISRVCRKLGIDEGIISLVFTDNRRIKTLNKKYFSKDQVTDVICFDLADKIDPTNILAEIIISVEEALKKCRRFNQSYDKELFLYIIHGLLHLIGFNDLTKIQRKKMRSQEKKLLSLFEDQGKKVFTLTSI